MLQTFKNVLRYRELVVRLAFKNLKVQYDRPFLGFWWSFFIPLSTVCIFQIIFSIILRMPVEGYPFFIYLMTAIFPWRYFQASIRKSTGIIVESRNLLKDVSFPKELLPVSVVLTELINFIPTLFIMIIFIFFWGNNLSFPPYIIFLPVVMILHTFLMIGISLLVSVLQVKFRDIRYIVEIFLLGMFYLTPIFYSLGMVADRFNEVYFKIYLLNPLVGIISLYRTVLLDGFGKKLSQDVSFLYIFCVPLIWAFVFIGIGYYIFKKNRKFLLDYLSL